VHMLPACSSSRGLLPVGGGRSVVTAEMLETIFERFAGETRQILDSSRKETQQILDSSRKETQQILDSSTRRSVESLAAIVMLPCDMSKASRSKHSTMFQVPLHCLCPPVIFVSWAYSSPKSGAD
jgi:hypothetical protein